MYTPDLLHTVYRTIRQMCLSRGLLQVSQGSCINTLTTHYSLRKQSAWLVTHTAGCIIVQKDHTCSSKALSAPHDCPTCECA